jgi:hypothetical protein
MSSFFVILGWLLFVLASALAAALGLRARRAESAAALEAAGSENSVEEEDEIEAAKSRLPDNNPWPVVMLAWDGTVVLANEPARDAFRKGDLLGELWPRLFPALDWPAFRHRLETEPLATHFADVGESALMFTCRLVRDADSKIFVYAADVTDLRRMSKETTRSAAAIASAVLDSTRTIEDSLQSGRDLATMADSVLRDAESTQQHTESTSQTIARLGEQADEMTAILETTKEISERIEILSLNAALEGIHAGQQGRGFTVVASEMRKLGEQVTESVTHIKGFAAEFREVTGSSVRATVELARIAADTTASARKIRSIATNLIRTQETETREVKSAMHAIDRIAQQTAEQGEALAMQKR